VARYGGEEFVVLMPDTPLHLAEMVAERLRKAVADTAVVTPAGSLSVTISLGVAQVAEFGDTVDHLLQRADQALYEAKRTGRNRWIVADDGAYLPAAASGRNG
jgi:two-component system cell cycle response regulator